MSQKTRTAAIALRLPWLYSVNGTGPKPGSTALLDTEQLKAVRKAVKHARRKKLISAEVAETELEEVQKGLNIIERGPLPDVGAWVPPDEIEPPDHTLRRRRRKKKAARQARRR